MNRPIIEVRALKRAYRKGPCALKGVDLDVPGGARFACWGRTGRGNPPSPASCAPCPGGFRYGPYAGRAADAGSAEIRAHIGVSRSRTSRWTRDDGPGAARVPGRLYGMDLKSASARADELIARFGWTARRSGKRAPSRGAINAACTSPWP
jgi:ABC-type multidrug transport system ATPase subunit